MVTKMGNRLRHLIVIEEATDRQDSTGQVEIVWRAIHGGSRSAQIEPLRGREFDHANATESSVSHRVTMRYLAGIKPKMRIVNGPSVLEIVSVVDVDFRHEWLELMCQMRD